MNSPIFKIPEDVLLTIIGLNTTMGRRLKESQRQAFCSEWQLSALQATHRAAQICRHWRTLVLRAAWMWARIIDLNLLNSRQRFREVVFERAGSAPLSIQGDVDAGDSGSRDFMANILKFHWSRIRSLEVTLHHSNCFYDDTWLALRLPAPVLEIFNLELRDPVVQPWRSPTLEFNFPALFSNSSPCLRSFNFLDTAIDFGSSWLRQLREFQLAPSTTAQPRYTTRDLFLALSEMPLLESLSLHHTARIAFHYPDAPVTLPNLQFIEIVELQQACCLIFDYLILPPAYYSNVVAYTPQITSYARLESLSILFDRLSTAYTLYLGHHISSLKLWIDPEYLGILIDPIYHNFSFGINCSQTRGYPADMLRRFCLHKFRYLTDLYLYVSFQHPQSMTSAFKNALESLSAVTTLTTTYDGMELLTDASDVPNLPSLRILKLDTFGAIPIVVTFMLCRQKNGLGFPSFETLDLTLIGHAGGPNSRSLEVFDGYYGLKMLYVWGGETIQYVCGSGSPWMLNFKTA